jgi:hypothetical protein
MSIPLANELNGEAIDKFPLEIKAGIVNYAYMVNNLYNW